MMFAHVVLQIEQFDVHVLIPFDELVIAAADGAAWAASLIRIVRIMPEQGTTGERLTLQKRHNAHPVDGLPRPLRQAGGFQKSRIIVGADDRCAADAAGLNDTGPAHDERFANPPS